MFHLNVDVKRPWLELQQQPSSFPMNGTTSLVKRLLNAITAMEIMFN